MIYNVYHVYVHIYVSTHVIYDTCQEEVSLRFMAPQSPAVHGTPRGAWIYWGYIATIFPYFITVYPQYNVWGYDSILYWGYDSIMCLSLLYINHNDYTTMLP